MLDKMKSLTLDPVQVAYIADYLEEWGKTGGHCHPRAHPVFRDLIRRCKEIDQENQKIAEEEIRKGGLCIDTK